MEEAHGRAAFARKGGIVAGGKGGMKEVRYYRECLECATSGVIFLKHIVMFSGGAASSVMAKFVADEHPEDTILLYNPTGAEHPDADRFREEVADFIGLPITVEAAKKNAVGDGRELQTHSK